MFSSVRTISQAILVLYRELIYAAWLRTEKAFRGGDVVPFE
jgi:hypothetical protein